ECLKKKITSFEKEKRRKLTSTPISIADIPFIVFFENGRLAANITNEVFHAILMRLLQVLCQMPVVPNRKDRNNFPDRGVALNRFGHHVSYPNRKALRRLRRLRLQPEYFDLITRWMRSRERAESEICDRPSKKYAVPQLNWLACWDPTVDMPSRKLVRTDEYEQDNRPHAFERIPDSFAEEVHKALKIKVDMANHFLSLDEEELEEEQLLAKYPPENQVTPAKHKLDEYDRLVQDGRPYQSRRQTFNSLQPLLRKGARCRGRKLNMITAAVLGYRDETGYRRALTKRLENRLSILGEESEPESPAVLRARQRNMVGVQMPASSLTQVESAEPQQQQQQQQQQQEQSEQPEEEDTTTVDNTDQRKPYCQRMREEAVSRMTPRDLSKIRKRKASETSQVQRWGLRSRPKQYFLGYTPSILLESGSSSSTSSQKATQVGTETADESGPTSQESLGDYYRQLYSQPQAQDQGVSTTQAAEDDQVAADDAEQAGHEESPFVANDPLQTGHEESLFVSDSEAESAETTEVGQEEAEEEESSLFITDAEESGVAAGDSEPATGYEPVSASSDDGQMGREESPTVEGEQEAAEEEPLAVSDSGRGDRDEKKSHSLADSLQQAEEEESLFVSAPSTPLTGQDGGPVTAAPIAGPPSGWQQSPGHLSRKNVATDAHSPQQPAAQHASVSAPTTPYNGENGGPVTAAHSTTSPSFLRTTGSIRTRPSLEPATGSPQRAPRSTPRLDLRRRLAMSHLELQAMTPTNQLSALGRLPSSEPSRRSGEPAGVFSGRSPVTQGLTAPAAVQQLAEMARTGVDGMAEVAIIQEAGRIVVRFELPTEYAPVFAANQQPPPPNAFAPNAGAVDAMEVDQVTGPPPPMTTTRSALLDSPLTEMGTPELARLQISVEEEEEEDGSAGHRYPQRHRLFERQADSDEEMRERSSSTSDVEMADRSPPKPRRSNRLRLLRARAAPGSPQPKLTRREMRAALSGSGRRTLARVDEGQDPDTQRRAEVKPKRAATQGGAAVKKRQSTATTSAIRRRASTLRVAALTVASSSLPEQRVTRAAARRQGSL
ncbi:hypothetical protein CP532_6104, partial [Ophiocordyceps camponoti-leonardi (nom. inval.)]